MESGKFPICLMKLLYDIIAPMRSSRHCFGRSQRFAACLLRHQFIPAVRAVVGPCDRAGSGWSGEAPGRRGAGDVGPLHVLAGASVRPLERVCELRGALVEAQSPRLLTNPCRDVPRTGRREFHSEVHSPHSSLRSPGRPSFSVPFPSFYVLAFTSSYVAVTPGGHSASVSRPAELAPG